MKEQDTTKQQPRAEWGTQNESVPFSNTEEAWFWFVAAMRARRDGASAKSYERRGPVRPCEAVDIQIVLRRLHQARLLLPDHLRVMRHYGLRFMPPDPRRPREVRAGQLWAEAMEKLTAPLVRRGIVLPPPFLPSEFSVMMTKEPQYA